MVNRKPSEEKGLSKYEAKKMAAFMVDWDEVTSNILSHGNDSIPPKYYQRLRARREKEAQEKLDRLLNHNGIGDK